MKLKIGYAKDPLKRLADMQVANANTLELVAVLDCKSPMHAREMERRAHDWFSKSHMRGEWFHYNKTTARRINNWLQFQLGGIPMALVLQQTKP